MKRIRPVLQDAALKAEIDAAAPAEGIVLWWLGQSGFLVKSAAATVLFDPYLSDALTLKYEGSSRPHIRMTERAIAPGELTGIDLVTSSHNHTDHLDTATLQPLLAQNPGARLVIPEANRHTVSARLGCPLDWPLGISDGQRLVVGGAEIYALPAAHNEIERDALGRPHYLGYVVRLGSVTLYHSGDTLRFPEMEQWLRPWAIDIAILPINGHLPARGVAGNLSGPEAAQLAHDIGARLVIPCHYEMFTFNTASPEPFIAHCRRLGQPFRVLQCGEKLCWPFAADQGLTPS